jgi:hypothetical protein
MDVSFGIDAYISVLESEAYVRFALIGCSVSYLRLDVNEPSYCVFDVAPQLWDWFVNHVVFSNTSQLFHSQS